MHIYFLRHGEADWPGWDKPDDERPLTPHGKQEMKKVAAFFDQLDVSPSHIVTSPLPRAEQTAAIMAKRLDLKLREEDGLRPGFGLKELKGLVKKYPGESLMVVGHEPDFTEIISALTGATLKLSKAGLALVDANVERERGRLLWLFPPRIAKAAR